MLTRTVIFVVFLLEGANFQNGRDNWDEAESALKDFVTTVQAAIDAASLIFDRHQEIIAEESTRALVYTSDGLVVIVDTLSAGLNEVRTYADGTNDELIENCILASSNEIRRLPQYIWQAVERCVTESKSNATAQIDGARAEAERASDAAGKLRADIDGCYVAGNPQECISRVHIEILLLTLEVPTNIQELTRRTEDLVTTYYENEMMFCASDRLSSGASLGNSILLIVRSCARII